MTSSLAKDILGTWELQTRYDRAANGTFRDEPVLGSDPIALLTYTKTRFSAQFMRRNRSGVAPATIAATANNTASVDGFDAYFGSYVIGLDGDVIHRLEASIAMANVGMEVSRNLKVVDGRLMILLKTAALNGEEVTRTLTWQRCE